MINLKDSIIEKLKNLYIRFQRIEFLLSQKKIILDKSKFKKLSKEYLNLSKLINLFLKWKKIRENIYNTKLLLNDLEMIEIAKEELKVLNKNCIILENKIQDILLPNDCNDLQSCFIEIRAATGGDEAAIFAGDLLKMYGKYCENNNWNIEIMSCQESEYGGFKEVILKITGLGVFNTLQFESGGHRVQRIPKTEAQGRIHTSTCTVAVIAESIQTQNVILRPTDLKIDTFRSSGAGGQHVNTTDSAIRITHIPTGTVVECQDERSQHKNKSKALSILSSRIYANELAKRNKESAYIRRNLLGSGDRSDRNRTYNFPKNRVTDHRINLTLYCLNDILNGNLDCLINPIRREYKSKILSHDENI